MRPLSSLVSTGNRSCLVGAGVGYAHHVRVTCPALVAVVAGLSLTACSTADEPEVTAVTQRFLGLAGSEPAAACTLLAPRTVERLADDAGDCAAGLRDARLRAPDSIRTVTVAIDSAQVVLSGQVVFLARFDTGWLVTAAGCTRASSDDAVPYRCPVEGD